MNELVSADDIERIVGVKRHPTQHYARAVSAEQTVYILHSFACKDSGRDLRGCLFSQALDNGIDEYDWSDLEDQPVRVTINRRQRLIPVRHDLRFHVMTARDDDLRADLLRLAARGTGTDLNPTRLVMDPRADRWWGEYLRQLDERWRERLRAVLDAHAPATEPESPSIEDTAENDAGLRFRIETACDGYSELWESDVPDDVLSPEDYLRGAHDAAEAIREAGAV